MRILLNVTLVLSLCLLALGTLAQDTDDPATQAKAFLDHLVAEDYAAAVAMYDAAMIEALPLETTQATWESIVQQFGAYQEVLATSVQVASPNRFVVLTTQFEDAVLNISVTINPDGQVAGLFVTPGEGPTDDAEATPEPDADYINPDTFVESEVTVGTGTEWELPGTLALPVAANAEDSVPAVILLPGSGPTDRDSTYGPNKPLRDIAQGLATQGIAVLRYDKRPAVYGQQLAEIDDFTLQEEYIDDALNALALLQETEGIDTAQIYLLGHSLGGTAAPRVAAQAPEDAIAGLILAAPSTQPLHEAVLRQVSYLSALDDEIDEQEQAQIDAIAAMVETINAAAESDPDEIDLTQNMLGVPLIYWLDLLENDIVAITADLALPVLIVQGERDYQVTVEDDIALWREAFADDESVTINTYPDLNHLFMTGEGPGNPAEYETPGRVDAGVVDDIAAWIMGE